MVVVGGHEGGVLRGRRAVKERKEGRSAGRKPDDAAGLPAGLLPSCHSNTSETERLAAFSASPQPATSSASPLSFRLLYFVEERKKKKKPKTKRTQTPARLFTLPPWTSPVGGTFLGLTEVGSAGCSSGRLLVGGVAL